MNVLPAAAGGEPYHRARREVFAVDQLRKVCARIASSAVSFRWNALCFVEADAHKMESVMESGLSAGDLLELRAQLQKRERELIAELEAGRERASSETFERLAGEAPDSGDASVADTERDGVNAERERDSAELREVRDALARMDAGTYGVCLICGGPIPRERLRAFPTARYDVEHQAQQERFAVATPKL
ncbi:MAG TPA: TraR/DksA C4-type zinc finger protein [Steroidobacteraceae bacterium]|nr:TraR/DksA C4-type zinc finger protein [Steroidobacteraceae bacterium]